MTIKKINNHRGKKSSLVKKMKKSIKKNNNNKINKNVNFRRLTTRRNFKTKMNKKVGGGEVELTDPEITIFVSYLASDDREFITKCSKHVNSDVGDDENVTKVKAVLAKVFPDQRDCEGFALNVLGKVSLFQNLYDYHKRMTDKLTKEGKKSEVVNIHELTPERIQRISRAMEGRCDVKSNNNSVLLIDEDKKVVLDILESVYSVDSIKSIFETMCYEKEKIQPHLDSLKQNTNDQSVIKDIKDLQNFADMVNEITVDTQMINDISYDIRKIGLSYFGFSKDNKSCQDSIIMMGYIKTLIAMLNPHNKFTHGFKNRIINLILKGIMANNLSKNVTVQVGGGKTSYEKMQYILTQTMTSIDNIEKFSSIKAAEKFYKNIINPQNILTKILSVIGTVILFSPLILFKTLFESILWLPYLVGITLPASILKGLLFCGNWLFKKLTYPFKGLSNSISDWWTERKTKKLAKKEEKERKKAEANEARRRDEANEARRMGEYININATPDSGYLIIEQ
jgi:hypothetical protein